MKIRAQTPQFSSGRASSTGRAQPFRIQRTTRVIRRDVRALAASRETARLTGEDAALLRDDLLGKRCGLGSGPELAEDVVDRVWRDCEEHRDVYPDAGERADDYSDPLRIGDRPLHPNQDRRHREAGHQTRPHLRPEVAPSNVEAVAGQPDAASFHDRDRDGLADGDRSDPEARKQNQSSNQDREAPKISQSSTPALAVAM